MGSNEKEKLNTVPAEGEYNAADLDAVMKNLTENLMSASGKVLPS